MRYMVFFYTGTLPIVYTTGATEIQNLESSTISFGRTPQFLRNKVVVKQEGFSINLTGIYPETFYKTFSVYNTGNKPLKYLVGIKNEHKHVLKILNKQNLNQIATNYYSNEDIYDVRSGEGISYGELTSKANSNFEIEITSTGLKNFVNKTYTGYVDIYSITGNKFLGKVKNKYNYETNFSGSGFLYKIDSFPIYINLKDNNTKIIKDDYYFNYTAVDKAGKKLKLGEKILFDKTGFLNISNPIFGLTFYSTGLNIISGEGWNDLYRKINRIGEYSNTGVYSGLKNIYPNFSGESYLYAETDAPWIEITNPIQNFKWSTGFSGFFDNINYNPLQGALQQDLVFKINTINLLPNHLNTGEENNSFILEYSGSQKIMLNGEFLKLSGLFKEGKNYRFFQKDFNGTNKITILNKPIKEYAIQKDNTKRLFELNPDYKTYYRPEEISVSGSGNNNFILTNKIYDPTVIYFSGNYLGTAVTGASIIHPQKNDIKYSGEGNNEWFIYTIQPSKILATNYIPVKDEIPSLLEKWNFTGIRKEFNSITFYPKLDDIRIITERNKNTQCLGKWKIAINSITGCYTNEQALNILSNQFINGIKNPTLQFETGKNYHFIRVAASEKEITGAPLTFYRINSGQTYFEYPYQTGLTEEKFSNYLRITHKTHPNFATGFFNGSNKYFEYIKFYTSTNLINSINSGNFYTYRASGVEARGIGNYISISEDTNVSNKNTGYYQNNLSKPVFSGNIYVYNSDLQNSKIQIPIVLSGVTNMDYIK